MGRVYEGRCPECGYHRELFLGGVECPNCQEIMGNTMIEVTDQRGDRHVFGQYCGSCGKKLEIHRENEKAPLTCPKCREGIMVFDECGLWD